MKWRSSSLPEEVADDPARLERLEREARALAAPDHPSIVTPHSIEEAEGIHFLTQAWSSRLEHRTALERVRLL